MTAPAKTVKYILMAFVAVSIGAAIYKALPGCPEDGKTAESAVETAAPAQQAPVQAAAAPVPAAKPAPAAQPKPAAAKAAPEKSAVVYYFYTAGRCYSCNLIESYTRETVEQRFAQPYNGWRVEFRGVNIEEKENEHFVRDYRLSSKSVVVQKFEGEKPLNWSLLKSVWQLLGSKERYMAYVAGEVHKTLDGK